MINRGAWVCISKTVLKPDERAKGIPDDTARTPLTMWVCGFLESDALLGSIVSVRTKTNRLEIGLLEEACPTTVIDYGDFVPEILQIGAQARQILNSGGRHE